MPPKCLLIPDYRIAYARLFAAETKTEARRLPYRYSDRKLAQCRLCYSGRCICCFLVYSQSDRWTQWLGVGITETGHPGSLKTFSGESRTVAPRRCGGPGRPHKSCREFYSQKYRVIPRGSLGNVQYQPSDSGQRGAYSMEDRSQFLWHKNATNPEPRHHIK